MYRQIQKNKENGLICNKLYRFSQIFCQEFNREQDVRLLLHSEVVVV